MHAIQNVLFICGRDDRAEFCSRGISHLITIGNPGAENTQPAWFSGEHLPLWFGDVVSKADADTYNTRAPQVDDIRRAILFFRNAWRQEQTRVLVSCDYGASRSPALAYVCLADRLRAGMEAAAMEAVLEIRPESVPNSMVVRIGDLLLKRNGALLSPLQKLYAEIAEQCPSVV